LIFFLVNNKIVTSFIQPHSQNTSTKHITKHIHKTHSQNTFTKHIHKTHSQNTFTKHEQKQQ